MEPDGPPVNYGITAHHSSLLGSKGKAFNTAGILVFLGKKLWGASLMPLVLGRLSTLEGWVGNEWKLEGYHAFRKLPWLAPKSSQPFRPQQLHTKFLNSGISERRAVLCQLPSSSLYSFELGTAR